ncbi:uncharacterized protein LOC120886275 isoform X1 [Ictidomys tridecemlineatus]
MLFSLTEKGDLEPGQCPSAGEEPWVCRLLGFDVKQKVRKAVPERASLPASPASLRTLQSFGDCNEVPASRTATSEGMWWRPREVSLTRKIKTFATKMVITSGNDEDKGGQEKESKEESVLAMLGIIGTILNLIVIIFVYIYTTL